MSVPTPSESGVRVTADDDLEGPERRPSGQSPYRSGLSSHEFALDEHSVGDPGLRDPGFRRLADVPAGRRSVLARNHG